ncbi:MAG: hypothetical protein LDL41_21360, partial [Coleofasciculus sp. S288]|nr:hypothetical protein [Coleofasciculus sp. S288]
QYLCKILLLSQSQGKDDQGIRNTILIEWLIAHQPKIVFAHPVGSDRVTMKIISKFYCGCAVVLQW